MSWDIRIIKIYGGMTGEFDLIRTDAPDNIIEQQLSRNSMKEEEHTQINNPYSFIMKNGYYVETMGCQDDFSEEESTAMAHKEFDYHQY